MKRLFGRREKDKPRSNGPVLSSAPPTVPIFTQDEHQNATSSRINGLLAPSAPVMARRKSSFFLSVLSSSKNTFPGSQTSSEASSAPPTTRSISGSSDASSSFMSTPIDERVVPHAPELTDSDTKSWPSWMGSMGKGKLKEMGAIPPSSSFNKVARPPVPSATATAVVAVTANESSDDESEESTASSWDEHAPRSEDVGNHKPRGRRTIRAPASGRRQLTPHSKQAQARAVFGGRAAAAPITKETSKALANLQALTIDALVPPTCAPPLVQTSSSVPFPRSSNRVQTVHNSHVAASHRQHSPLHTEILRKRLLRRIERRLLTETEQESIQLLASRPPRPRNAGQRKLPAAEETYEDSKAVGGGWSKGMKRWAMRPCFEERAVVWKPLANSIIVVPVQRDSRCSVAALEFSEGAEALAGLHRQNELPPPPSDIYVPASSRKLPPPLVIPRSPTGMNKSLNASGPLHSRGRIPSSRLRLDTALLSGQDEDDLPLGVVMIQRRQKEEAEERRRRVLIEKLEREKKVREEEERTKQYAEQVAAARARREIERMGKLGSSRKDAWLDGDGEALPPPPKPYALHSARSSSNPDLTSSSSSATLQVARPFGERRMTSESVVASTHSGTTVGSKSYGPSRQQTAPPIPSPWTAIPSGPPSNSGSRHGSTSGVPRLPNSAPATQMNYGMMMGMPIVPDPLSLALFEQGLLRPWAMDGMHGGSSGTLTPPRLPFGFGSSGDSSGSLTPPRFPNSRPPSLGSSSEDVRLTMQRMSSAGSIGSAAAGGARPRPVSGAYSSGGSAEDWRRSRNSMLVSQPDDGRNRSHSRSPVDPPAGVSASSSAQRLTSSMTRNMRSENNATSSSSLQKQQQQQQQPQQQQHHRSRPSASSAGSNLRPQERSRTHPPPPPPPSALKGPYGLPTVDSFGSSSSSTARKSTLSTSKSTEAMGRGSAAKTTGGGGASGQEMPRMHAHSKSTGPPTSQRKSRLFG